MMNDRITTTTTTMMNGQSTNERTNRQTDNKQTNNATATMTTKKTKRQFWDQLIGQAPPPNLELKFIIFFNFSPSGVLLTATAHHNHTNMYYYYYYDIMMTYFIIKHTHNFRRMIWISTKSKVFFNATFFEKSLSFCSTPHTLPPPLGPSTYICFVYKRALSSSSPSSRLVSSRLVSSPLSLWSVVVVFVFSAAHTHTHTQFFS